MRLIVTIDRSTGAKTTRTEPTPTNTAIDYRSFAEVLVKKYEQWEQNKRNKNQTKSPDGLSQEIIA